MGRNQSMWQNNLLKYQQTHQASQINIYDRRYIIFKLNTIFNFSESQDYLRRIDPST